MTSSNFDDCKTGTLELCHVGLGHVAAGVLYCDGERGLVVSDFRVRGPHPRRPLEPSIHVLEQELLEPLTKRDQRGVRCCHRYSSDRDGIQNEHWKDEGGSPHRRLSLYKSLYKCSCNFFNAASHKSSGTFP